VLHPSFPEQDGVGGARVPDLLAGGQIKREQNILP
jgi:hypothetical protein